MAGEYTLSVVLQASDLASSIFQKFTRVLNGIAPGLGTIAGAALGVGAAVVGLGTQAVTMAGTFQESMTQLVTGAGESQKNIGLVSNGILNMAVQTGTSTQQLASGMFMIESASYHGAAGLQVLQVAAEGAKVGNADLGTVADALTTTMKDYHISAGDAATAMNTLTATVANGKTHMQDLAMSLSRILPYSQAAGVGLNQVMGAMAGLTAQGVTARQAAQNMKMAIVALDAPTKSMTAAFTQWGLSSTQIATRMKTDMPGAFQEISNAVSKVYKEGSPQYLAAIKAMMGGSSQMASVVMLSGSHFNDFKSAVDNVSQSVTAGKGSVMGWSDVQKDFNFKISQAQEVVETLMIRIGTALLPVLSRLMDQVLPLITQFTTWITKSGILQQAANDLSNAIGGTISVISSIISFIQKYHTEIGIAAGIITMFFVPAMIKSGVQAVINGAKVLYSYVANIVKSGLAGWQAAQKLALWIASVVKSGAQAALNGAKIAATWVASVVKSGAMAAANGAKIAATWIASVVRSGAMAVANAAKITATFIASMIRSGAMAVWAGIQIAAKFVASLVMAGVQAVITAAKFVASLIPAIVSFVAQALVAAATAVPAMVAGFIAWSVGAWSAAAATIAATWPVLLIIAAIALLVVGIILLVKHWGAVTAFLKSAWQACASWLEGAFHHIAAFISSIWTGIKNFFAGIISNIIGFIKSHWQLLVSIIGGPVVAVVLLIVTHWNQIKHFLAAAWAWVVSTAKGLWNDVTGVFRNAWSGISSAVSSLWNNLVNFVSTWSGKALQWGKDLIQNLINGILSMIGGVGNAIGQIAGKIASFIHFSKPETGPLASVMSWMPDFGALLASGLVAQKGKLQAAVTTMVQPIAGGVSSVSSGAPTLSSGAPAAPSAGGAGGATYVMNLTVNAQTKVTRQFVQEIEAELSAWLRSTGAQPATASGRRW